MSEQPILASKLRGLKLSNEQVNRLTKESLQIALIQLMQTKEFNKISLTELTKRAGVSRTAYYSNYDSKQAILEDTLDNIFKQINDAEEKMNANEENNIKKKHDTLLKIVMDHKLTYRTILKAGMGNIIQQQFNEIFNTQNAKTYQEEYLLYFLSGAFYNTYMHWLVSEDPIEIEQLTELIYSVCSQFLPIPIEE